jgi:hypothetical protein
MTLHPRAEKALRPEYLGVSSTEGLKHFWVASVGYCNVCHYVIIKTLLYAGFLLGLFFDPENGGDMFF